MIIEIGLLAALVSGIFCIGVALGFYLGQRITNHGWVEAVKDHSKEFK